jgi:predicted XRE-type DNA-binding protein
MNSAMTHSMNIRKRPRYQIVSLMRRAGISQTEIAHVVGVDQSFVSLVLGRRVKGSDNAEAVWVEIERRLTVMANAS